MHIGLVTRTGSPTDSAETRVTGTAFPYSKRTLDMHDPINVLEHKTHTVNSTLTYEGWAANGSSESASVWRVKQITNSGGSVTERYADEGRFTQAWASRTSLFPATTFFNSFSVNFDGVNDYLNGGDVFAYDNATAWSLSMWVRPQNVSAQRCLYSKVTDDANVFGWGLYHTATGAILLQMRASGQLQSHTSTATLSALTWTHLVMTYNGSQNIDGCRLYFDSVVDTTPSSGAVTNTLLYSRPAEFGRRNSAFYFSGHMDEISVWDKALSSTEVASIYNSGSPQDVSTLSFASNLVSHYRCGDIDAHPTILDAAGSNDLTMVNMSASNFQAVVP